MERSVTWEIEPPVGHGLEIAFVQLGRSRLDARGAAVRTDPYPYMLDYILRTTSEYVTRRVRVRTRGSGWRRSLDLHRERDGRWSCRASSSGALAGDAPGCRPEDLDDALDCDLGLSPLTNSMPVLRHGLLEGGGPVDLLMAWISVPELVVVPSRQRYEFVRRAGDHAVVRYSSGAFSSEITFDSDGLVVDYPGLARRIAG